MPRRFGALLVCFVPTLPAAAAAVCAVGATTLAVPQDCPTVKAAVAAIADGGTVELAAGTAPLGGAPLVLSNLAKAITFHAPGPGATTFSGGGTAPIVLIENGSAGAGRPIVFEGVRFANGRSTLESRAGGVTLLRAEATFADCEFESNAHAGTTTGGGALAVLGGSRAVVVRSRFEANSARNNGGAIYAVRNAGQAAVSLWVAASELLGNTTAEPGFTSTSAGGAIYARNARVRIADSRFESNLAGGFGGGVYLYGAWGDPAPCDFDAPAADLLIARTAFLDNRADDAANAGAVGQTAGGALHAERCSRVRLYSSLLEANEADKGGAVALDHAAMTVEQSVFRHNRARTADTGAAPTGGAVTAFTSQSGQPLGPLAIERTLFVGGLAGDADARNAHNGGCLRVAGDAANRRAATIADSTLFGCNGGLLSNALPNVRGGGLDTHRANLTLERVLFARNSVEGDEQKGARGGGMSLLGDSVAAWTGGVMAGNAASDGEDDLIVTGSVSNGSVEEWTESPPASAGVLVAAPSRAAGPGGPFAGEAVLAYAWQGDSATLDEEPLGTPRQGLVSAAEGEHGLAVEGLGGCARCAATIDPLLEPSTTVAAAPEEIAAGGSATLSWQTPDGELLAALVDRGVGETGAAGQTLVAPGGSSTWRRLVFTRQGGAIAEARVWVDETPPLFADGFEGGLATWSEVAP